MRQPDRALWDRLDRAFDEAIRPLRRFDRPASLLFSGGVDSALLAHELRAWPDLELVVVGGPGSPDVAQAERAARLMGLPLTVRSLRTEEVAAMERRTHAHLRGADPTRRSVAVAFALAVESARNSLVLSGQGADELFLGYRHFEGLDRDAAEDRCARDLASLRDVEWPRAVAIAQEIGHELSAPYLAPAWVEAATSIPIEARMPRPVRKALFRSWAEHRGLPPLVAAAPKRALQYGSGVHRMRARALRPP